MQKNIAQIRVHKRRPIVTPNKCVQKEQDHEIDSNYPFC